MKKITAPGLQADCLNGLTTTKIAMEEEYFIKEVVCDFYRRQV